MNEVPTIHLIANAHLDPVWLWDWREGLNEGVQTIRTVLDLMDEYQDLTFIRGESLIYGNLEAADPISFERVRRYIEDGRWDFVGGTYVQADNNLPSTEVLVRQFLKGQSYFASRFGRRAKIAWSADAFGHSAGLPDILSAVGIEGFAFSRPVKKDLALFDEAFWWEGGSGNSVLAYRSPTDTYLSERDNVSFLLDQVAAIAAIRPFKNHALFFGVGNHGGGPVRQHLEEIAAWRNVHPEVEVKFSTLHGFFAALSSELDVLGRSIIPTYRGELGHCLRGCYASSARFKYGYRKAEARLASVERSDAAIHSLFEQRPRVLADSWEKLLFSTFHDILPGTSIERAVQEQQAWLGSIEADCQSVEFRALNQLGREINTAPLFPAIGRPAATPILLWNPHLSSYSGQVEVEACLDYRPLFSYEGRQDELPIGVWDHDGQPISFQEMPTEHRFMLHLPWRKRLVVDVTIPAAGWTLLEVGVAKEDFVRPDTATDITSAEDFIANSFYKITAKVGEEGIHIESVGKALFDEKGMTAVTFRDPWGSWGGMSEEPDSTSLTEVAEVWKITQVKVLERGPKRAKLFVSLQGSHSSIDLTYCLAQSRNVVDVSARVFWNERHSRLKLVFPVGSQASFDVPGGVVERGPMGEVPGGRWVAVRDGERCFGFGSDALYCYALAEGELQATVVRSAGYAVDSVSPSESEPWLPVSDRGELRWRFVMQSGGEDIVRLTRELEQPPITINQPVSSGPLPRTGSLMELSHPDISVLALKRAEDGCGYILRLQSLNNDQEGVQLTWHQQVLPIGNLCVGVIRSFRIFKHESAWQIVSESALEQSS